MDTLLAIVALLVAAVGLGFSVKLQHELQQLRALVGQSIDETARARALAGSYEQRLLHLEQAMVDVRTAMEAPVLVPRSTPRARGLDDLREHLRVAHATADEEDSA
jgi:hypothetical protein